MVVNFPLGTFLPEFALIAVALGCLALDVFLRDDVARGRTLASVAMTGTAAVFALHLLGFGARDTAFAGTIAQDGISFFFRTVFLLAGLMTLFMSRSYQSEFRRGHSEFPLLVLFAMIGMLFLVDAADFLVFFIGLETLTVSLYVMTAYLRDRESSIEAGVKYLVLGALSTAVFLYGLSFVYGATGSTSYAAVGAAFAEGQAPAGFFFGATLVVASLFFKISAVPFQLWAPDVYEGAPTPVTAFLAVGSKAAGFAALLRFLLVPFSAVEAQLTLILAVVSALTIFYGNLGAIVQTNIKRLLAYSSIGHAGYMLMGLVALRTGGGEALLYYSLGYLFSTGGAFLVLVAVTSRLKKDSVSELAGLATTSPILAAAMFLSLMSLAGVPPLAGFFGKFYLLFAVVKSGYLWLAVVGVLNVITSLYFYLKIVKAMYVDAPSDPRPVKPGWDQKAAHYFAILGILALGIWQGPFVRLAEWALKA